LRDCPIFGLFGAARRPSPQVRGHIPLRGRPGLGGVDEDPLAAVGGQIRRLVGKGQVADHWMMQLLGACAVELDVVGGPANPEFFAAGGELADEAGQAAVIGVRPASARRIATAPLAIPSQPAKNSVACGLRKMNRG